MGVLDDLRVVEVSAFVAAPLGGMTLAQLGAEVIRIDPIGGGIDYRRWPLSPGGESLYWAGLNKGKRSVALALNTPEGRELASAIAVAGQGVLLTNLSEAGWLSYARLSERRSDMIMARLTGDYDGAAAVDYTVNCASGFPLATGRGEGPVNHVLPAWDIAAGLYMATGLLAAERHRTRTGQGQEIRLALSDVMLATAGHLGYIADVAINGAVRPPSGNDIYGAYGRDFQTRDNERVMVAAMTTRHFKAIVAATGTDAAIAEIEAKSGLDFQREGDRYKGRNQISAVLEPWFATHDLAEIRGAFGRNGVLWGRYQDFGQLVREDPRCSTANPLFQMVEQPGIGSYLAPGAPIHFGAISRDPVRPAPRMGEHTEEILSTALGLSSAEIGGLRDRRVIG